MKIDVIINAAAGEHLQRPNAEALQQAFADRGVEARILHANGTEVVEIAERAVQGDADAIVAGGGDGTINTVVSVMLRSTAPAKPLGILPLGTLNHLAKDLNIPLEIEKSVDTIAGGHVVEIDLAQVNDRFFINNSSLGLYPSIVRERQKQQRLGSGKWPAFVWAAFSVLRRYPFLDLQLKVKDKELKTVTPFVFVGNNKYEMESLNIGSRSRLNGGSLSLYMTKKTGRLQLIRLALLALFRKLRHERDFVAVTTDEVSITTRKKRLRVALDGEVTVMEPPLRYRIRPRALKVFVPADHPKIECESDAFAS